MRLTVALPGEAVIDLAIHDVQGRLVRNVAKGHFEPGYPELIWDGFDEAGRLVASGIYFARLVVNEKLIGMERVVILTD